VDGRSLLRQCRRARCDQGEAHRVEGRQVTGATDTVSMVIRNVVRQLETPDRLRGRMMGVNMVFFMGGPQLGELEAGAVANWLGAPFSVISGGIGCLLATGWVAATTPALRHYRRHESTEVTEKTV
jgi:hypothetical protein